MTFALYVALTIVVKGRTFTYPSGYVVVLRLWRIPRIYHGKNKSEYNINPSFIVISAACRPYSISFIITCIFGRALKPEKKCGKRVGPTNMYIRGGIFGDLNFTGF